MSTTTDKSHYHRPRPPADPDQEYMDVQETAYVLKCGMKWLRELLRANPHLCGRNGGPGKKIITDREQRAAIHAIRSAGDPRKGRSMPRPRRRTTAARKPALAGS